MRKPDLPLLPPYQELLKQLGYNLRLQRKSRRLRITDLAKSAIVSEHTIKALEAGRPGVALGSLMKILGALHIENDILQVGQVEPSNNRPALRVRLPKRDSELWERAQAAMLAAKQKENAPQ